MKRVSFVALLATVLLMVGVATPAQGQFTPVSTHQIPSDGTIVSVPLAPGAYNLVVSGTYDYDSHRPGDQLADAECTTEYPAWRDPIDQVADVVPVPLSVWHRYRFIVGATEPGFGAFPPSFVGLPILNPDTNLDALDVAIGVTGVLGSIPPLAVVEWVPNPPTIVNSNDELDAGCNEDTHVYQTPIVVPPGVTTVDFQIWDPTVVDNVGSLTLDIESIP